VTQVVVITGCSTGIGKATALAFARRGDRVYATMRAPERGIELQTLIDAQGLDAEILPLDVTDDVSVRNALSAVVDQHARVDVVVNNAGIGPFAPVERTTDHHWLETLDTNLLGAVRVARAALPTMRAQGNGTIVNISSVAGRLAAIPTQAAYAASKHALCAFTDSLVAECAAFGIQAYCIEPGFFATAIMDKDTVLDLDEGDPYKAVADGVQQFFRASVAAAPSPHLVAEVVLAAADGSLDDGVHHPVGVAGLEPTANAARQ
jgi:NAD(P)-dependent dehydrogenase (short-subunit alcohol dehydrogenase family)